MMVKPKKPRIILPVAELETVVNYLAERRGDRLAAMTAAHACLGIAIELLRSHPPRFEYRDGCPRISDTGTEMLLRELIEYPTDQKALSPILRLLVPSLCALIAQWIDPGHGQTLPSRTFVAESATDEPPSYSLDDDLENAFDECDE